MLKRLSILWLEFEVTCFIMHKIDIIVVAITLRPSCESGDVHTGCTPWWSTCCVFQLQNSLRANRYYFTHTNIIQMWQQFHAGNYKQLPNLPKYINVIIFHLCNQWTRFFFIIIWQWLMDASFLYDYMDAIFFFFFNFSSTAYGCI